ncbi:Pr6Pr family membrane protein [Paraburkholderia sp.]|uniref:Pr6Pr family membrane protein n=1 Tax=Paraburkholderia sp. TaxID=1926495 RepID=UPI00238CD782|nr:Pr6Pr family membrane protein [Paraburkholderia sp.]MDE1184260.1 Pr6Pr family membrane protein [Paraburkholderia sp.]
MAGLIALIAWVSFALQTDVTIHRMLARGLGVIDGIERLSSYLTNLTVFACAICFTCVAVRARTPPGHFFRRPPVVTAIVVYVVFVGIAYNVLLRHLWTPSGYRAMLNECLHTVIPLLAVVYWLLFVPRFHLLPRDCLSWLLYPLCYLFVTLWRGSRTGFYPYPFIDVDDLGYRHVFVNASLLVLGFVLLMGVFVAINHRRPRVTASSRDTLDNPPDA